MPQIRQRANHAGPSSTPAATGTARALVRDRITKNKGMKSVATNVAASMPPNTPVPIERRAPAPAPPASTSGKHTEHERERSHDDRPETQPRGFERGFEGREPLGLLLRGELHDQNGVLRRQADQDHQPDLEIDIVAEIAHEVTATSAPNKPNGTASNTAAGSDQRS